MQLDYLKLLERSARMVWKHKILWLFGFLSALGGGGWSSYTGRPGSSGQDTAGAERIIEQGREAIAAYLPLIVLAVGVLLLIGLVLFVLGYIARGGLIGLASSYAADRPANVGDGFQIGWRFWLRLLGIDLVLFLPLLFGLAIVVGAVVAVTVILSGGDSPAQAGAGIAFLCLLFAGIAVLVIVLIPLIIFLSLLQLLAHRSAVLSCTGVLDSIRDAYAMLRRHFWDVVLVWLMRLVIGIGISFVTFLLGVMLLGIPIAVMLVSVIAGVILLLPGLLVLLFVTGVVTAFTSVLWTLAYEDIKLLPQPSAAAPPPPPIPA